MTGRTGKRLYAKAIIRDGRDECHKIQTEMPFKAAEDRVEAFQRSGLFLREGEKPSTVYTIPAATNAGTVVQSMDRI